MKKSFLEYLANNIVLFDGAMGTEIYEKGIFINCSYDELNLSNPGLIGEVHKNYIEAGAEAIETNTYGANRIILQKHGLEEKLYDINFQGAKIAKEIAGDNIYVAGSMGPLRIRLEPWGTLSKQEAKDIYREQSEALINGGVDLLILETFSDLNLMKQAIIGVKEKFSVPIIAQMTITEDGNSLFGNPPVQMAVELAKTGADVVGINCSVGPKIMLEAVEKMVAAVEIPVSVMPNAGIPQNVYGRNIYLASPEYFGEYAKHFALAGARVIGSCCGTNPGFTKQMHKTLKSFQPKRKVLKRIEYVSKEKTKSLIPIFEKSDLSKKITEGKFVTTVEIVPPKGSDPKTAIKQAKELRSVGVDAINIPDGPRALSRMGASYLSLIIQQQANIEVIQHYACRDRNLLGMVGDLLGAYGAGIKNILIITGDPPKMGTYPDATAVFDVDSIGLTNVAYSLNCGKDIGDNPLKKPTRFFIGVGVNPNAIDLDYEISRFERKVKAGAEFAITQPIFDVSIFTKFLQRIKHVKIPIIVGIWPLVSIRNAEFLNHEVPGVQIPDSVMGSMYRTTTKDEARKLGLKIARDLLFELKPHIAGVQVSMPFGNINYPLEIIKDIL